MARDTLRATRREYLLATAGLTAAFAGCTGDSGGGSGGGGGGGGGSGGGGGGTPTPGELSGSDYPVVEQWLTETTVGGSDDTYDGTIVDRRGRDTVEIEVGAAGNGGNFAFGPSAVAVSPGTTVRWVWTGEGGAHNVRATPAEQLGKSDYEFSSGDPAAGEGTTFERTLADPGIALYHCEPHLSLGMKGAVVVTS